MKCKVDATDYSHVTVHGRLHYSVPESARILNVTPGTIYRWCESPCRLLNRQRIRTRTEHCPRVRGRQYQLLCDARDIEAISTALDNEADGLIPLADAARMLRRSVLTVRRLTRRPVRELQNRPVHSEERVGRDSRGAPNRMVYVSRRDIEAIRDRPRFQSDSDFSEIELAGEKWIKVKAAAKRLDYHHQHVRDLTQKNLPELGNHPLRSMHHSVNNSRERPYPMLLLPVSDIEAILAASSQHNPDDIEWGGERWIKKAAAAKKLGLHEESVRARTERNVPELDDHPLRKIYQKARDARGYRANMMFVACRDIEKMLAAGNGHEPPRVDPASVEPPAPEKSPGEHTADVTVVNANDPRDEWLYRKDCEGLPAEEIISQFRPLCEEHDWTVLDKWKQIRKATDRYAKRHRLPQPPRRQQFHQ